MSSHKTTPNEKMSLGGLMRVPLVMTCHKEGGGEDKVRVCASVCISMCNCAVALGHNIALRVLVHNTTFRQQTPANPFPTNLRRHPCRTAHALRRRHAATRRKKSSQTKISNFQPPIHQQQIGRLDVSVNDLSLVQERQTSGGIQCPPAAMILGVRDKVCVTHAKQECRER